MAIVVTEIVSPACADEILLFILDNFVCLVTDKLPLSPDLVLILYTGLNASSFFCSPGISNITGREVREASSDQSEDAFVVIVK